MSLRDDRRRLLAHFIAVCIVGFAFLEQTVRERLQLARRIAVQLLVVLSVRLDAPTFTLFYFMPNELKDIR